MKTVIGFMTDADFAQGLANCRAFWKYHIVYMKDGAAYALRGYDNLKSAINAAKAATDGDMTAEVFNSQQSRYF